MPVLRSDEDVNHEDPAVAAQVIVNRVDKRPLRFHWFRNILKSPTWYVQVVDEVHQRNPNIELLDGATFFALYRKYLENTPDAAKGLRSEEHTSELQSLMRISYAVFCLKKKEPTY